MYPAIATPTMRITSRMRLASRLSFLSRGVEMISAASVLNASTAVTARVTAWRTATVTSTILSTRPVRLIALSTSQRYPASRNSTTMGGSNRASDRLTLLTDCGRRISRPMIAAMSPPIRAVRIASAAHCQTACSA